MFLKHFMCTVYKSYHDECLKNISSITFIFIYFINVWKMFPVKPNFLSYFINI